MLDDWISAWHTTVVFYLIASNVNNIIHNCLLLKKELFKIDQMLVNFIHYIKSKY